MNGETALNRKWCNADSKLEVDHIPSFSVKFVFHVPFYVDIQEGQQKAV